jgi:hypothetical protein
MHFSSFPVAVLLQTTQTSAFGSMQIVKQQHLSVGKNHEHVVTNQAKEGSKEAAYPS